MILVINRTKLRKDNKNFLPYFLKIIGVSGRICTEKLENSVECNLSSNESISSKNLVKCPFLKLLSKPHINVLFNKENHVCFEQSLSLRKKYPCSEFFLSVFYRRWTKCEEMRSIAPYSARRREHTDQKNSEYEHFPRSVLKSNWWLYSILLQSI